MNAIRFISVRGLALTASLLAIAATTAAQVPLADQPVFSSVSVPGNMALALSVEFPTAISVAHPTRTYASTNNYLGYFDPGKCYKYKYVSSAAPDSDNNYFYPTRAATDRVCSGEWSGNFLNWASMQTIDPFRWALTGGYRWIDTPDLTVLEKAWSTSQGSAAQNFPESTTTDGTVIAGATPFVGAAKLGTAIWSYGNKMRFVAIASGSPSYSGTAEHFSGTATLGKLYEVFVRVKVCDNSVGKEANCVAYSNGNYKPEGLMQKYASKIRYSAFGYLASDDGGDTNLKRDGAVLRASQRFIGPTQPVPGSPDIANTTPEWSSDTGVMIRNPGKDEALASSTATVPIIDSGVMNYLNKFGELNRNVYKRYDPVSELYYAALRYYRNLGNVPEWSSLTGVSDTSRKTMLDGFPIITDWKDPIQYSCQRNFILGIGDVNTHADRNLPGATTGSKEPAMPSAVFNDPIDAVAWTNKVGDLQNIKNLGTALIPGNDAGYLMAGLAYYANTTDIRPPGPNELSGKQTVKTYWLDVLEGGYKADRQFYLAAKYGGFNPPDSFKVEEAKPENFLKAWWSTSGETVGGQDKPDNYYTAARADLMVKGLTSAFASISSQLSAYSTSFVTADPQLASLGNATYATKFDPKTWTGDVVGSLAKIDAKTGIPDLQQAWKFSDILATQAAGTGWDTRRNIVTYNSSANQGVPLRSGKISDAQLNSLDTSYVTGDDKLDYLNYLRGDRSNEYSSTATGSTHAYRDRASLVGDVVNAKARPVGAPAAPYSGVTNPGYDKFKTDYAARTPMVYVGTNAGMVHAINGSLTGADAGKEVFAYVPGVAFSGPTSTPNTNGLASIGNKQFEHRFLVDATPLAADVDFGRTSGATGAADWRTLLVGGLGKGGKAIYALDITKPSTVTDKTEGAARETEAATKVLWEFTDSNGDLGYTYGQPVAIKTRKHGWVIVVGSGYNNRDGNGYFFFIDPRTGQRLEKISVPCSECSASNQAGLAHLNAFIVDASDGTADTIYGGDLMGNVWRLDVSGKGDYPEPVKFATLTDSANKPLPITTKPLPVVQPGTNRRYITVGTGRMLDSTDLNSSQAQRFFAILDGTNAAFSNDHPVDGRPSDLPANVKFPLTVSNMRQLTDLSTGIALDLRTEVGWYLDLGVSAGGPGWRVLSDPTSYYGIVAFAATAPKSGNACSPNGNGRVYALNLGSGSCALDGGGASCYAAPKDGVVVDVQIVADPPCPTCDRKSTTRVVFGDDQGGVGTNTLVPPSNLGLQRLNWREILINN